MGFFGFPWIKKSSKYSVRSNRQSARPRSRGLHFEPLEQRHLLSVTLAPITGPDANSAYNVPSGKDLYVPLTGTDTGQTISYTATSSDPNVQVSVFNGNPTLQMTVTGTDTGGQTFTGTMTFQLFQNLTPTTVSTIKNLVNAGFYNNLTFYRIVPDFVIQGGANGSKTEPNFNDELNVGLTYNSQGMLAMANAGPNTNTSEIFVTDINQPLTNTSQFLNYGYTEFGQLTSGFAIYNDVMNAIGVTASNSSPSSPVTITSAQIITDTQNGVLQITEPSTYTGTPTITVTANSTDGSTTQQSFVVNAAPPSTTATQFNPLFLSPIANPTTTEGTPVTIQLTANQYSGLSTDALAFSVSGTSSFNATPSNVTVTVNPASGGTSASVTLTPTAGFTGTINLVAHLDDTTSTTATAAGYHDALAFSMTVNASVSVTSVTNPIGLGNYKTTTATGTGVVGATISLTATDGTTTIPALQATVGSGGTWTINNIDTSSLKDGTITYNVTSTGAGTGTASLTATKATVVLSTVTSQINSFNDTAVAASGTGEVGATITLSASDGTNTITAPTTVVGANGTWTISGIDVHTLADGTITFTATASDTSSGTAQSTLTGSKDTVAPAITLTSVTNPINMGSATATTASGTGEVGATIILTATDGTNTVTAPTATVAANGTWTINNFDIHTLADGTITFSATATDTAGNTSSAVTLTATKNTTAPNVTVTVVTSPITLANVTSTTASGTTGVGDTVKVTASDGTTTTSPITATVDSSGNWSASGIDVSALKDGTITYTAIAMNTLGNTANASMTTTKTTVAITTATGPINATNASSVAISGTGQANASISVVVTDGTNSTTAMQTTVAADGTWSITGINASTLNDGPITYQVMATDDEDNSAQVTKTTTKDVVAPNVTITAVTNPINAANDTAATASGTTEVGATVTVVATDSGSGTSSTFNATVDASGNWTVSNMDLHTLADGTITFTATATDTAGNTKTATLTSVKDTVVPALTFTTVTSPINSSNIGSVTASGTVTPGDTVTVVATDSASQTSSTFTATVDSSGNWTATGISLTGLADGTITFTATATAQHGNTTTATKTATKDTVAPTVTITSVTPGVTAANQKNVSASGTGVTGTTITLTVTDGTNTTNAFKTTVNSSGNWTITGINVSALNDGTITFKATASDTGGNTAQATATDLKNTATNSSLSGFVYADSQNGPHTASSTGIQGVVVILSGVDSFGNPVPSQAVLTAADGSYTFSGLPSGVYSIIEDQPTQVADGTTSPGNLGGTSGTNVISNIALNVNAAGVNYNFIEQGITQAAFSINLMLASTPPAGQYLSNLASTGGTAFPVLMSMVKNQSDPSPTGTVSYTLTFNENVTGVDTNDFTALASSGLTGASVGAVTGGGTTYNVVVNTGTGSGTLQLELADNDTIIDTLSNPLGGTGTGNGNFFGPVYTIASTPTVAITAVTPSAITAANDTSVSVTGTADVGDTITIVATDTANTTSNSFAATVDSSGNWTVSGIDVSGLADGTITFTATAINAGSISKTATATATKDTVAPAVAVTSVTPSTINSSNATSIAAAGTTTVGDTVTVVATDNASHSSTALTATVDSSGHWTVAGLNVTGLNDGTITITATAKDAGGNTTSASMTATKDTAAPTLAVTVVSPSAFNATNDTNVTVSGTTAVGATVTVVATDSANTQVAAITATVDSSGNWTASGFNLHSLNDGTITFTATAKDAAGNTATATNTGIKDTVAPTVTFTSVTPNPINATTATNVSASGTTEIGSSVTVVATAPDSGTTTSYVATVDTAGNWTVSGIDVHSLADGTITFTATAKDVADNTSTATTTVQKDTVAPAVAITSITPTTINQSSATSVAVSGTTEIGATVTIVATDSASGTTTSFNATVDSSGNWTATGIDVHSLADGTITFTATAKDAAGNTATTTDTATKNTVGPTLTFATVTPDLINATNALSVAASGTTDVGATVTVVATDSASGTSSTYNATVDSSGNWTASGMDVSGLADGTITFTATATNTAGNSTITTKTATKDTVATGTIDTITPSTINSLNDTGISVGGTTEVGSTVTIVATDSASGTSNTFDGTVDSSGNWTASGIDVSGLADGTITFTATFTDTAGNTSTNSKTAIKDTVAPTLTFTTITPNPINAADVMIVAASGTTSIGATVTIVATDSASGTSDTYNATVNASGIWTVSGMDVSGLVDGTITFTAAAASTGGNLATATSTAVKDTVTNVTIAAVTDPINTLNDTSVSINGMTEIGDTVKIVATDSASGTSNTYDATVDGSGNWTATGIDVSTLADGTITFTATATDTAGNVATLTKTATKNAVATPVTIGAVTPNPISGANDTQVSVSGTTGVGDAVKVVATDSATGTSNTYDATVDSSGNWTASGIDVSGLADGTITFTATATSSGINPGTATSTAVKDTVTNVTIVAVTDPITTLNDTSVSINGTTEIGDTVKIVATDSASGTSNTYDATVDGSGNWTASGIDVSTLADGTITFTATATDTAGNVATLTKTATKNAVATPVTIGAVTPNPISGANDTQVSVSGTTGVGDAVKVVATDSATGTSNTYDATVDSSGNWTASGIDVSGLADGTITFTATATSAGINPGTATSTAVKDTVTNVTIAAVTDPINTLNDTSVSINGTTEIGDTVKIVATDSASGTSNTYDATVDGSGNWTASGIDVSGLADGTITFTASATDTVGNLATLTKTATKNTVATPVTIGAVTPNPINSDTDTQVSVSGTTGVGDAVKVVATDSATGTSNTYDTTVDSSGNWTASGIDVSGLADGTITFTATATSAGINPGTATATAVKDTVANVTIATVTSPIDTANATNVSLSGRLVRQLDGNRCRRAQPGGWHDHLYRHRYGYGR
jgi:cyclophilin family peptidyl-prolyl cis-trans isomerase